MEDSFKLRVDKVFGSLDSSSAAASVPSPSPSPSPASSLRSLWSLTDDEIERKEWNRDKGIPEQESEPDRPTGVVRIKEDTSRGVLELEEDLEDLEEEEELEEDGAEPSSRIPGKPDDYDEEEWEIKSSIGRDCTVDLEEEEDVFDKVAVGREKAGDRLYMKDFNDYGIDIDSGNQLPSSIREVDKDPRANHIAAKLRLIEDEEAAAGKLNSLPVSEGNTSAAANTRVQPPEDDVNVKSILKRRDGQTDSKSQKRVRFDPEFVEKSPGDAEDVQMETEEAEITREVPVPSQDFSSAVPDHIRNPSRYTHYTFDSSDDVDEQSNRQAYMDFLNIVRRSKGVEDEALAEPPKSVMFVPRKKRNEAVDTGDGVNNRQNKEEAGEDGQRKGSLVGIVAGDDQDSETCAMEEDETEPAVNVMSSKRAVRQYRLKPKSDVDE